MIHDREAGLSVIQRRWCQTSKRRRVSFHVPCPDRLLSCEVFPAPSTTGLETIIIIIIYVTIPRDVFGASGCWVFVMENPGDVSQLIVRSNEEAVRLDRGLELAKVFWKFSVDGGGVILYTELLREIYPEAVRGWEHSRIWRIAILATTGIQCT